MHADLVPSRPSAGTADPEELYWRELETQVHRDLREGRPIRWFLDLVDVENQNIRGTFPKRWR